MNDHVFMGISNDLRSWPPPVHMFVPLKCSKKPVENAPVQNTCNSENMPNINELETIRPSKITVRTVYVFSFIKKLHHLEISMKNQKKT